MSKVDELLNGLSEEEIAVYTATPAAEPHIVINEDRSITVPTELKNIAVQFDSGIETVTFDCPRYWDGHDLSEMQIYINYKRPDNKVGGYLAENKRPDVDNPNIFHFDWTLKRDVTEVKGTISILVCAKTVDETGNETQHWNSQLNQELNVLEGMDCETSVIDDYPAIITSLLSRMKNVEDLPPTVQVTEENGEYHIIMTDVSGTYTVDVQNGATFTPSVDAEGNLSWTNDKDLENPATVNIRGPMGPKGDEITNLLTLGTVKVAIGSTEAWEAYTGDKTDVLFIPTNDNSIEITYLSKEDAENTYLAKTDAETTYLAKEDAENTYLSKDDAENTYLAKTDAENTYLAKTDAETTYLAKDDAENTYLSKDDAENTYLSKDDAENTYLSKDDAENTYLSKDDAENTYLSKDDAENTYLAKTDVVHAETADKDGDGNVISETYLKKPSPAAEIASENPAYARITKPGLYAFSFVISRLPKREASGVIAIHELENMNREFYAYGLHEGYIPEYSTVSQYANVGYGQTSGLSGSNEFLLWLNYSEYDISTKEKKNTTAHFTDVRLIAEY